MHSLWTDQQGGEELQQFVQQQHQQETEAEAQKEAGVLLWRSVINNHTGVYIMQNIIMVVGWEGGGLMATGGKNENEDTL